MSQRVLITGGTGFVGKHLVPHLIKRGFDVTVGARQSSAASLRGAQYVYVGDLRSDIDWKRHLEGMDAVVHLAALAHLTSDIPESEYDRINFIATARLAKAASNTGVKLIFISSVAAQSGSSSNQILNEADVPRPASAYGRSKLHAELEIKDNSPPHPDLWSRRHWEHAAANSIGYVAYPASVWLGRKFTVRAFGRKHVRSD